MNIENDQKLACLALHLCGVSLTRKFLLFKSQDYTETGISLYGSKFFQMIEKAGYFYSYHKKIAVMIITIIDEEYPRLLKDSLNPPLALFCSGNLGLLQKNLISIVGTRKPSLFSSLWISKITGFLSRQNLVIVSGVANGIDSIVHANALAGGTIGILPHSLDIRSPVKNRYLFEMAPNCDNVLLISEYPVKTETRKYHFVHRNRIIAGISGATILTEAGLHSGALLTANYAIQNRRRLFALNHELQKCNEGNMELLKNGLALKLTDFFPVGILPKNFSQSLKAGPLELFYIGNQITVFFNENYFSTKFLEPA